MYHGTSWKNACDIERDGFEPSEDGMLGPGVYVARYEKAHKFACAFERHGGQTGGMIEVLIRFRYPKYVSYNDDDWQADGYDACRTDETSASTNMEWCVASPSQARVLRIWQVDTYDESDVDDADEDELREHE